MQLLLVGGFVLTIAVCFTLFYFSLATFVAVNAKALDRHQKAAQKMATKAQMTHLCELISVVLSDFEKLRANAR